MTFPDGFRFGSGASGSALEGTAPAADLARWEHEGRVAADPDGSGFASSYRDDLAARAELGLADLRLTLEWARLEPVEGRRDVEAVEHLRLVLEAAREAGLRVWGCLHDGTLPGWFAHDEHGYADARSRGYFWARHVERVAETFGDLVHGWVPVYEPSRWALRGWIQGSRPPGRVDDAEGFAAELEGAHLASVEAALRLGEDGHPVASAQWMLPLFPARAEPGSPAAAEAEAMVSVLDATMWGCWRRMLLEGTLQVPGRPPVAVPDARRAFDVIGITYRHAAAVQGDGVLLPYPQTLAPAADGQVPWVDGLERALAHAADVFGDRPLLVAGLGLPRADPDVVAAYARDARSIAADAAGGGVDLRGLWWNAPIDALADVVP
ncbi:MAG: family 1 glycosylhydrolase [Actinobacteria bacterium]|nr:family 1 glycosylhydrolase [Actinomycetota bacterium]